MDLFLKFDKQVIDVSIVETNEFAHGSCSMSHFILNMAVERRFKFCMNATGL